MSLKERVRYGYRIKWSNWDGTWNKVETSEHLDPETAQSTAMDIAKMTGFRPRKWWQFWRWLDEQMPIQTTFFQSNDE